MVSENRVRDAAGITIIAGAFLLLYALVVRGELTVPVIGAVLPLFGLGAALVVGGGAVMTYLKRVYPADSN
ncbi:hypothetical protein [Haloarchaeobius amylolyticus]|uniref:hypothetical protein n=1 Tax=Haloarchaeobius amylolyticus TaxID=1198296 RepID=UPI00226F68E1|nr:hypothetical protein [Haloarchaeobius amylolyticus]